MDDADPEHLPHLDLLQADEQPSYDSPDRVRSGSLRLRALTGPIADASPKTKVLVKVEIESRARGRLVRALKYFVLACRAFVLLSPSMISDLRLQGGNSPVYVLNLACSAIIFVKLNLVLAKKRRRYFREAVACVDYVACAGVLLSSLCYWLNGMLGIGDNDFQHYYFWAVCCFVNVADILNHLKQFKLVAETLSILGLAVRLNYPFFYVMLMLYLIFASIGEFVFGGNISSATPARMAAVGQPTKDVYVYHNWNDFLNAVVFLYSINLNNNLPLYVNMSTAAESTRSAKPLFFVAFYLLNNIILMNVFVGQIIEISLAYFKAVFLEARDVSVVRDEGSRDLLRVKV